MSSNGSEAIQVVVRIRPMQKHEVSRGDQVAVIPLSEGKEIQIKTDRNEAQRYRCNQCFSRETEQLKFFEESTVKSLIDSVVEGYRACVFAFGQTGAGKTYTMVGPSKSITPGHVDDGLIGRSLDYMFTQLDSQKIKYSVRISCLELYQENVYDLLADDRKPVSLPVREHAIEGFFLEGSKMVTCTNFKQACCVIDIAMRHRHIGENDVNVRSSRSHCITEIYVDVTNSNTELGQENDTTGNDEEKGNENGGSGSKMFRQSEAVIKSGKLSLIDLAGSERLKSSRTTRTRLQEAGFINKSLYVLGKVIAGLARTHGDLNHRDVPYRDSKLTKLLINSLGGRGRTMLIACVTEASGCQAETLRTLKFSMSCARIKNRPVRFLDPQQRLITELRDEMKRLRTENKILRTSLASAPSDLQASLLVDMEKSSMSSSSSIRRILSAGEDKFDEEDDFIDERAVRKNKKPLPQNSYSKYEPTSYRSNYGGFGKQYGFHGNYIAPKKKSSNPYHLKKAYGSSPMKSLMKSYLGVKDNSSEKLFQQDKKLQRLQDRLAKLESDADDTYDSRSSLATFSNRQLKPWQVNQSNSRKTTNQQASSSSIVDASDIIEGHRRKESVGESSASPIKASHPPDKDNDNDMLSDLLDALDDKKDVASSKKKVASFPNAKKADTKKASPYLAHLSNNPKRLKEISTDDKPSLARKAPIPKLEKVKAPIEAVAVKPSVEKNPATLSTNSSNATNITMTKKSSVDDLFSSFLDNLDSDDDDDGDKKKKKAKKTKTKPSASPVAASVAPTTTAMKSPSSKKSSVEMVQSKLDLLEQQLIAERQEMEDNPGDVTAEAELKLNELEKEAISMRMEIQISQGRPSQNLQAMVTANRMSTFTHHEDDESEGEEYRDDFDQDQDKDKKLKTPVDHDPSSSSTTTATLPQATQSPSSPAWLRLDNKSPKKTPITNDSPKYFSEEEKNSMPSSYSYLEYKKSKPQKSLSDDRDDEETAVDRRHYSSNNDDEVTSSPSYDQKKAIATIEPASKEYEDDFETYEDDFQ